MDKLRLAVVGVCGRGGLANHWRDSERAEVVAGVDVSPEHLDDFRLRLTGRRDQPDDYYALWFDALALRLVDAH